jgi:hypothetical protein
MLKFRRLFCCTILGDSYKTNWQLEKEKHIKPSLWWKEVAEVQSTQKTNTNTDILALSNLSMDGKAWFIHPIKMIDYFPKNRIFFQIR